MVWVCANILTWCHGIFTHVLVSTWYYSQLRSLSTKDVIRDIFMAYLILYLASGEDTIYKHFLSLSLYSAHDLWTNCSMSSDYYPVIVLWRLNIWLHTQFFSGEIVIRDVRFVWRILTDAVISSLSILKMEPKPWMYRSSISRDMNEITCLDHAINISCCIAYLAITRKSSWENNVSCNLCVFARKATF